MTRLSAGRLFWISALLLALSWVSAAPTSAATPAMATPSVASATTATTAVPGTFKPVTPTRLLDTRTGVGAPAAAVGPGGTLHLQVDGRGGVPATAVSAVVLNVAVASPTRSGFVTAYADGAGRPGTSNLNFTAGQGVANLVVAQVGANGKVSLYNGSAGSTHLFADVSGYYLSGAPTTPGAFRPVAPARVLDTRFGVGAPAAPVGPGGVMPVQVTGRGGVPATGVSAVVVNVTVTAPSQGGYATVYADGSARPGTSNLNFRAGQSVPNLVVARVGTTGRIALYNGSTGSTHFFADIAGYYLAGTPSAPGAFRSVAPARVLDTRSGVGAPAVKVAPGGTLHLQLTGRGGIPATGVAAVVLNVTVASPTRSGYATLYADGSSRPGTSNVNFSAGQIVPNLVVSRLGSNGKVAVYNGSAGSTHFFADVAGYYLAPATPVTPGTTCTSPIFTTSDPNGGISNGGYYVHNNLWNASRYPGTRGTTEVCSYKSWNHYGTATNTGDGAVKTYPNVHKDYSGRTISSFPRLTSTYAATAPGVGIYNVAYDLWLNGVPNDEVMIWTDNHNQVPAGSRFASGVSLGGRTWDVYATSGNGYIAFVPSGGARYPSGTVDLKAMLTYLVSHGRVASGSTVDQICYGVEIVDTGGSQATWHFTDFSITDS
ncbi:GH12 family glycosyl hydrolase domain-containing protein [Pedococcus sp. 5OH_020]|uniref:GH12 family glycosyl hydrolase domain-containing protein n=1 Tax=Pedococcus sp. 5OH_020 TaxID=2989814 RepID=UPI0022E9A8E3|nr:hypothetical protein [Pedococcus sp. 5OH_020]